MSQICAITGPTSGIGEATALALAEKGFHLILICRSAQKGEALAKRCLSAGASNASVELCDLASLQSVREAGERIAAGYPHIDILINNAGVVCNKRELSVDGHELMFASNHLGPFLLTRLLLPALEKSPQARIINVASGAHAFVKGIQFDDLGFSEKFSTFKTYGHSKLCNMLFTLSLSERLADSNISVNSLHPGAVSTGLGTQNGWYAKVVYTLLGVFFRTPAKGAESSIYLATDDAGLSHKGVYFYNCKPLEPKPWAKDREAAEKLWQVSAEITGLES